MFSTPSKGSLAASEADAQRGGPPEALLTVVMLLGRWGRPQAWFDGSPAAHPSGGSVSCSPGHSLRVS